MIQKNKLILITSLFLVLSVIIIILLKQSTSNNTESNKIKFNSLESNLENNFENNLILYYGEECPHCAIVEQYLKSNPLKLNIEKKEVYYNKINQDDLKSKAKLCGIPLNQIGVPFLWNGEECILGDQPIIEYFKNLNN